MPRSKKDVTDAETRALAPPAIYPSLTEEKVREYARAILEGHLFSEAHIRPQDARAVMSMVFMPLALGDWSPEVIGAMEKNPPGMCFAWMKDTFPRSINGYPIFSSCFFLSREDTERVWTKYEQMRKALEAV